MHLRIIYPAQVLIEHVCERGASSVIETSIAEDEIFDPMVAGMLDLLGKNVGSEGTGRVMELLLSMRRTKVKFGLSALLCCAHNNPT